MRRRCDEIFSGLLLCLFMNFVFSNTVFMHTHHTAEGRLITHSHPYLPSGATHTHSASTLSTIAFFNLSSTAMMASDAVDVMVDPCKYHFITISLSESVSEVCIPGVYRRGPPIAA